MRRMFVLLVALSGLLTPALRAQSLINNGSFVGGTLTGWTIAPLPITVYLSSLSASADGSGSAEVILAQGSTIAIGISQCATGIAPGTSYAFGGKLYVPSGQPTPGGYGAVSVRWYSTTNCSGVDLGSLGSSAVDSLYAAVDTWHASRAASIAPPGARSARVEGYLLSRQSGTTPLRILFDEIFLQVAGCQPSATTICLDDQLRDGRFAVSNHFSTAQGGALAGDAHAISLSSLSIGHGGLFWFFDPTNPEMLAKVLNGCATNGHFWVFLGAGTNVGMTTTVRDSLTGRSRLYTNADRHPAAPVQDTTAFPCTAGDSLTTPAPAPTRRVSAPELDAALSGSGCAGDGTTLCIGGRFRIQVAYQTSQGGGRADDAVAVALDQLGVSAGGLFWFFTNQNPEMLIKVIDGCGLNDKFWVFYSATTNVGFTVTVTDTANGHHTVYTNADLNPAAAVQDTQALDCP